MSDDEKVQAIVEMPRHLREAAQDKTDFGEMSERVRALYREVAYGEVYDERQQLQARLDELTEELSNERRKKREIESNINDLETEIDKVQRRISERSTESAEYKAHLESLEAELMDGRRVTTQMNAVATAAEKKGVMKTVVIEQLKERNPDVPDYAFELAEVGEPADWRRVEERE